MNRYCTYFDQRYLDRGLAMMRSLRAVDPDCQVTVLCLTASCEEALARLQEPGVTLIPLVDFEARNPALLALKGARALRDYYLAFASFLIASELCEAAPGEVVTYLDADLLFYSSPKPIFSAMENASVGLIGHRHHWWTRRLEKYGRLNVGWVSVRCDDAGLEVAHWWRARCIEWCFADVDLEGDRFAEQKYLDHMLPRFPRVVEITHPGVNLGPWNICRHSVARDGAKGFAIDGKFPLIFVHYSGIRETRPNVFLCSNVSYLAPFSRIVRNDLYRPYLRLLKHIREELGGLPKEDTYDLRGSLPSRRVWLAWGLWIGGWALRQRSVTAIGGRERKSHSKANLL